MKFYNIDNDNHFFNINEFSEDDMNSSLEDDDDDESIAEF